MIRRVAPIVALIAVANAAILGSVAANRAGEPGALVTMTERELPMQMVSDRDSSQKLRLVGSSMYFPLLGPALDEWFTVEKARRLGFNCRPSRVTSYRTCGLPRRAYAVFEYEGPAWARIAEDLRRQMSTVPSGQTGQSEVYRTQNLQRQIDFGSRLAPVDASSDPVALRRAHPNPQRDLILPVVITAYTDVETEANRAAAPTVHAQIELATPTLVVPNHFRDQLAGIQPSGYGPIDHDPRYSISLAVGRHYEPWIVAIKRTK
jgi:Domain of unknown function (DUF4824)